MREEFDASQKVKREAKIIVLVSTRGRLQLPQKKLEISSNSRDREKRTGGPETQDIEHLAAGTALPSIIRGNHHRFLRRGARVARCVCSGGNGRGHVTLHKAMRLPIIVKTRPWPSLFPVGTT